VFWFIESSCLKRRIIVDGEFWREMDFSAVGLHRFNRSYQQHPRDGLTIQSLARKIV